MSCNPQISYVLINSITTNINMSCQYFIDPCLFPALSEQLTQAFNHLSSVLPDSFQQVSALSSFLPYDEDFSENNLTTNVSEPLMTPIIICLPSEYSIYKHLLLQDSPPCILSPLWVLSSALCRRLQPMVRFTFLSCSTMSGHRTINK